MGIPKTTTDAFSAATLQAPLSKLTGPVYVRLTKQPVHVDDRGNIKFQRPLLETRQVSAEPTAHGRYSLHIYTRTDFQDELIATPETSSWSTESHKYEPEIAVSKMKHLMEIWEGEGFVRDTITPETPSGPATPKP